jgi:hypothetical protein
MSGDSRRLAGARHFVPAGSLTERAADALRLALAAGRAHIAGRSGELPDVGGAASWGWRLAGTGRAGRARVAPAGPCIGWVARDVLWLDPGATVAVLAPYSRGEGDPMRITVRALSRAFAHAGLLLRTSADQYTIGGCRAGSSQRRVWELPVTWLFPQERGELESTATDEVDVQGELAALYESLLAAIKTIGASDPGTGLAETSSLSRTLRTMSDRLAPLRGEFAHRARVRDGLSLEQLGQIGGFSTSRAKQLIDQYLLIASQKHNTAR